MAATLTASRAVTLGAQSMQVSWSGQPASIFFNLTLAFKGSLANSGVLLDSGWTPATNGPFFYNVPMFTNASGQVVPYLSTACTLTINFLDINNNVVATASANIGG